MTKNVSKIHKEQILRPFKEYLSHRTSWWGKLETLIFRNHKLSNEKIMMTREIISEVNNFKGTYEVLNGILEEKKEKHAALSLDFKMNHFNLAERRPKKKITFTRYETSIDPITGSRGPTFKYETHRFHNDVRKGELSTRSHLAEAFHMALESKRL